MRVRLSGRLRPLVVLVTFVMNVSMGVFQRIMDMLVLVTLCHEQPHSGRHESSCQYELTGNRFTHDHGDYCAKKWRHREICARSRSTEMP
jgi:hypothetical protein